MNIHFISGLPRSGSTLLAAILNQNPNFQAGIISPIAPIVSRLLNQMSLDHETSVFITDDQRQRLVRAVFTAFYNSGYGKTYFDSNRAWCAKLPLLGSLFPNCKVIACVREVPWIFDSIERLTRKNAFQPSALFKFTGEGTVYSRCERLAASDGMVGFALNALRTGCFGEEKHHIMLLRYETLATQPAYAVGKVYEFIGAEPFQHDFTKIEIDATVFDNHLGAPGLHAVRPLVDWQSRTSILPTDLWDRYKDLSFWDTEYLADVTIV